MSDAWVQPGQRRRVPYANPQGRRLNSFVLDAPNGPAPALDWASAPRHLTSADRLCFLRQRPLRHVPLVIVLDHAGLHRSATIRAAVPERWRKRVYLFYLPPYSPHRNDVERLFRRVKHDDLPQRTYPTVAALHTAVDQAFRTEEAKLLANCSHQPGQAA